MNHFWKIVPHVKGGYFWNCESATVALDTETKIGLKAHWNAVADASVACALVTSSTMTLPFCRGFQALLTGSTNVSSMCRLTKKTVLKPQ